MLSHYEFFWYDCLMALIAIVILSALSYFTGVRAVLRGQYKPNVYSRIIWFLLALNGLIGVIRLGNDTGIVALSLFQTVGSLLILLASLKYSIMKFGKVELISSLLLVLSGVLWLFNVPAINVGISLVAHFIGGIPTFATVSKDPKSENVMFWFYFCIASFIAFIAADKAQIQNYMFALYFMLFNLIMVILAGRQYLPIRRAKQV